MYCNYCGKVIQDDAVVCAYCGIRVGSSLARKRLMRPRNGRKGSRGFLLSNSPTLDRTGARAAGCKGSRRLRCTRHRKASG